jgi:serine/threonine protein kinase
MWNGVYDILLQLFYLILVSVHLYYYRGVILFTMLVGVPPFSWADMDDAKFRVISQGGLGLLLKIWNRPVSPHAEHLLQSMLMYNPQDRLTLFQVMNHPWILEESSIDSNGNVANGSNTNNIIQIIERMSPPKDGT